MHLPDDLPLHTIIYNVVDESPRVLFTILLKIWSFHRKLKLWYHIIERLTCTVEMPLITLNRCYNVNTNGVFFLIIYQIKTAISLTNTSSLAKVFQWIATFPEKKNLDWRRFDKPRLMRYCLRNPAYPWTKST